jgi:hypothetical protein
MKTRDLLLDLLRGSFSYLSEDELDEMVGIFRDLVISLRLMPAEVRQAVLHRIFWVSKILQFFMVLSATSEKELPPPMRPIFRYGASALPSLSDDYIRKVVLDPKNVNVGMVFSYQRKRGFSAFLYPIRSRMAVLAAKKDFAKMLPIKQKQWAKKLQPPAEKRYTEAVVYTSQRTPSLYVVMNKNALGRGNSIREAVDDFIRRWSLLISAEISSRLPVQLYIREWQLEPCGKILVVEYEDGETRWKFVPAGGEIAEDVDRR